MGASRDFDFSEYFAARVQRFRRVAFALCGDWHSAEDLVQAMFVQLYRRWRRVRPDTVDAYARRILLNAFLAGRKKAGREHVTSEPPERASPPDHDSHDRIDLERALTGLTPRQRAMVVLRFLEDLPVAEVASLLSGHRRKSSGGLDGPASRWTHGRKARVQPGTRTSRPHAQRKPGSAEYPRRTSDGNHLASPKAP